MKGQVFDIQHYCIHDGPGVRVNVFLKGCPLKCLWCQNPESQKLHSEIMHNFDKCIGCGKCITVCPYGAINAREKDGERLITTDRSKCSVCGKCVEACQENARNVAGKQLSVSEVFEKVNQDKIFFGSEGGITVTGGEPLVQYAYTKELLKTCKENGINTCIETCGYADWKKVKEVMEYVDLVLYDVKHMDIKQHKICTGVGNEIILDNLKMISQVLNKSIIIRVPIIPGYNAAKENIKALGEFIKREVPTCVEVNLLPFHKMGESKKIQLEEENSFKSRSPEEMEMEELRAVIRGYGIPVK